MTHLNDVKHYKNTCKCINNIVLVHINCSLLVRTTTVCMHVHVVKRHQDMQRVNYTDTAANLLNID